MAHNLDITNGVASFADARLDAWHTLGQNLHLAEDQGMTAEQALEAAHLAEWNVRKLPMFTTTESGKRLVIPGSYVTVRDNPIIKGQVDPFKAVGEDYTVIQNEANCDLLNAIVDESGAHFETAGALEGGRKVFVTMKLPGHIEIGGVDPVENYLAAINSHDGSMAYTLMVTPVRIVCANTLNLAFQSKSHAFRVRHTSGAHRNIVSQARQALDVTFKYLDGFQADAEKLINTTMTQSRFEEIIAAEFGAKEGAAPATITRCDNKLSEMSRLFADAFTQEGIRETAWAGLNALTEWADHFSPTRGDDRETARAMNAVMEPEFKNKALKLMMAQV